MTNPKEALEWYKTHGDKLEPKTISEIRAEIPKAFTGWHDDTVEWIQRHSRPDYQQDSPKHASREAARMLVNWAFEAGKAEQKEQHEAVIEQCYEYTAQDHKAWWVPDKNGEHVHIGDDYTVKAKDEVFQGKVTSLGFNGRDYLIDNWLAQGCEKVIPDSWDKWTKEFKEFAKIGLESSVDHNREVEEGLDEFVDRAKKLAEVD